MTEASLSFVIVTAASLNTGSGTDHTPCLGAGNRCQIFHYRIISVRFSDNNVALKHTDILGEMVRLLSILWETLTDVALLLPDPVCVTTSTSLRTSM